MCCVSNQELFKRCNRVAVNIAVKRVREAVPDAEVARRGRLAEQGGEARRLAPCSCQPPPRPAHSGLLPMYYKLNRALEELVR